MLRNGAHQTISNDVSGHILKTHISLVARTEIGLFECFQCVFKEVGRRSVAAIISPSRLVGGLTTRIKKTNLFGIRQMQSKTRMLAPNLCALCGLKLQFQCRQLATQPDHSHQMQEC